MVIHGTRSSQLNLTRLLFALLNIIVFSLHGGKLRSLSICFVCLTNQSFLKRNAQVLRTGSGQNGPARESVSVQFSSSSQPKHRNWKSCGKKNVCTCLGPFHLIWPEQALLSWQDQTNRKRPKTSPWTYPSCTGLVKMFLRQH